jgi:hypothetical protein
MKKSALLFLLIANTFIVQSQVREIGIFAGGSYYVGEINRSHFSQQQAAFGLIHRKDLKNNRVSIRFNLMYNQLKAVDFKSGNPDQISRNLSFKNSIIEFGPVVEVDFFDFIPGQDNTETAGYGTPYFFGGISLIRSDPKAQNSNGKWVSLQPLMTEGQNTAFNTKKKYLRNQIVIPFGMGVKVNLSHHICLSFEYGLRKTFSDYLDDVSGLYPDLKYMEENRPEAFPFSENIKEVFDDNGYLVPTIDHSGLQRGNSADKDWYMVSGISLTYELFNDSSCPKWK